MLLLRVLAFGVALGIASTAAAQVQPRLEIGTRQGNYYWVVETSADGSRRGGWVPTNVPLDAIDRNALKALPSASAIAASERPTAPAPSSVDDRLARLEQALVSGQQPIAQDAVQSQPLQRQKPEPRSPAPSLAAEKRVQTRQGFWFNGGFGYGSLGCQSCFGERVNGFSGGLSAGATVSPRLLVAVGTSGWYRSEDGVSLSGGTLDGRVRFYPVVTSGFFITGGMGLGHVSLGVQGLGSDTEYGVGAVFGLGWDIRVARNVSLTPFYNGFAVQTSSADVNVGQIGVGITIH
jgi:hypothetical protein